MSEEFLWAILAALILLAWIGLGFVREQLAARRRIRLRQMLHRERMAALEQGIELPDTDADDLLQESFARVAPRTPDLPTAPETLRRTVLGLGLVLLLGGIGWVIGMGSVPATQETLGMPELASLGIVPGMVGLGLLVFWYALGREAG